MSIILQLYWDDIVKDLQLVEILQEKHHTTEGFDPQPICIDGEHVEVMYWWDGRYNKYLLPREQIKTAFARVLRGYQG